MLTPLPHPLAARKAAGLRQLDLAVLAGCSLQTVCRCEASGTYPQYVFLRRNYLSALGLVEVGTASGMMEVAHDPNVPAADAAAAPPAPPLVESRTARIQRIRDLVPSLRLASDLLPTGGVL
jgi:transcriptional regulator with XRE-family HTH domain